MNKTNEGRNDVMNLIRGTLLAIGMLGIAAISDAKGATVVYGFDQLSNIYTSSSLSTELSAGSYFAFGSFSSSFDATTITSGNILSTLRDATKWFKAFETATLTGEDQSYVVTGTAATADNMYAYAVIINDTVENVLAAIGGSATGISKSFGVFTYVNTDPALRSFLPRDPAAYPGDPNQFSNEAGLGATLNNFAPVGQLGVVTPTAVALIPEPSSAKLLLVAALLALPWMRRISKECKI